MDKLGDDATAKFINALIKSVQTLCHGYLDFENGVEIIGHINLSVDKGNSLDYILKEKVCKNAENSTLFISNSFHAEPKSDPEIPGKDGSAGEQRTQNCDALGPGESGTVSSAISSISTALTGPQDRVQRNSGVRDSELSHSHPRTVKRKASEDQNSELRPAKVSSRHDSSHLSSESPVHPDLSSPVDSKLSLQDLHATDDSLSETMLPQTAGVSDSGDIGVNLAGSVLEPVENRSRGEREEDSDGDLEVTFIKEEFVEGERSACDFDSGQQFASGELHQRASEGVQDPSMYPVALHTSSASSTYIPGQHYPPSSLPSQPQAGPSGSRGMSWSSAHIAARKASRQASVHPSPHSHTQSLARGSTATPVRSLSGKHGNHGKALMCEFCDAAFSSLNGLRGHVNKVHLHYTPFTCEICGKGFNFRRHYEGHMNRHNNIKAFKCARCASQFTYRASLHRHMRDKHCAEAK